MVSLLDNSRHLTAAEFQTQGALYVAARRSAGKDVDDLPTLTDAMLEPVYSLRRELLRRWEGTKDGETLELLFRGPMR